LNNIGWIVFPESEAAKIKSYADKRDGIIGQVESRGYYGSLLGYEVPESFLLPSEKIGLVDLSLDGNDITLARKLANKLSGEEEQKIFLRYAVTLLWTQKLIDQDFIAEKFINTARLAGTTQQPVILRNGESVTKNLKPEILPRSARQDDGLAEIASPRPPAADHARNDGFLSILGARFTLDVPTANAAELSALSLEEQKILIKLVKENSLKEGTPTPFRIKLADGSFRKVLILQTPDPLGDGAHIGFARLDEENKIVRIENVDFHVKKEMIDKFKREEALDQEKPLEISSAQVSEEESVAFHLEVLERAALRHHNALGVKAFKENREPVVILYDAKRFSDYPEEYKRATIQKMQSLAEKGIYFEFVDETGNLSKEKDLELNITIPENAQRIYVDAATRENIQRAKDLAAWFFPAGSVDKNLYEVLPNDALWRLISDIANLKDPLILKGEVEIVGQYWELMIDPANRTEFKKMSVSGHLDLVKAPNTNELEAYKVSSIAPLARFTLDEFMKFFMVSESASAGSA